MAIRFEQLPAEDPFGKVECDIDGGHYSGGNPPSIRCIFECQLNEDIRSVRWTWRMASIFTNISILFFLLSWPTPVEPNEEKDKLEILWYDDERHPRRLDVSTVDYLGQLEFWADQFVHIAGGLDGMIDIASIIHNEIEEIFGPDTAEKRKQDKERNDRLTKYLPLFNPLNPLKTMVPSKPASKEVYQFDLGDGTEERHTVKGVLWDAVGRVVNYLASNENRARPNTKIFEDEL